MSVLAKKAEASDVSMWHRRSAWQGLWLAVRGILSLALLPSALRGLLTVASGKERDQRDELPCDVLVIGLAVLEQMTYKVCL